MKRQAYILTGLFTAMTAFATSSTANTAAMNSLSEFNNGLMSETRFDLLPTRGVENIATFNRGNTVVLHVAHDPEYAYEALVNDTLMKGARVNGLNFQTAFSLGMARQYCNNRVFSDLKRLGYAEKVHIYYKDTQGKTLKRHKISKNLCKIPS